MKIEITVSPTGQTTIETKGYEGTSCAEASRFLEEALGCRTAETLKPAYFQPIKSSTRLESQA